MKKWGDDRGSCKEGEEVEELVEKMKRWREQEEKNKESVTVEKMKRWERHMMTKLHVV